MTPQEQEIWRLKSENDRLKGFIRGMLWGAKHLKSQLKFYEDNFTITRKKKAK